MPAPTRAVTVRLFNADGTPCPDGTTVSAVLDQLEVYQGFVIPREVRATTLAGEAVLQLFPNAPAPGGLGTTGSTWSVRASWAGSGRLDVQARVPDQDVMLDAIATTGLLPAAPLTDAQAAVASAQAAAGAAGVSAGQAQAAAADADADRIAADAARVLAEAARDAAQGSATTAADAASTAGGHAGAAAGSAGAAAGSAGAAATSAAAAQTARTGAESARDTADAHRIAAGNSATAAANSATQATTNGATQVALAAGHAATAQAAAANAGQAAADADADRIAAAGSRTAAEQARDLALQFQAMAADFAAQGATTFNQMVTQFASMAAISALAAASAANAGTAGNQAQLAQTFAQSAASVAQQDLSGAQVAALHRSPNAVTAAIVYDTSRDSDGGAWIEQQEGKSWMREALNGAWLSPTNSMGFQSELEARAAGATLGAELMPNGTFASGTTGYTAIGTPAPALAMVNGELEVTAGASNSPGIRVTGIPTVQNRLYLVEVTVRNGTLNNSTRITMNGATVVSTGAGGSKVNEVVRGFFVPSTATSGIDFTWPAANLTGTGYISRISIREVTAFNTTSGSYYQLATDGRFYRLWRNILQNSALAGGTDGTVGSGAVAPTNWSFGFSGGTVAFAASSRFPSSNQARFTASASRPVMIQQWSLAAGVQYTASMFVEAIASGTPTIQDVLSNALPGTVTTTYRRNGGAATGATPIAAGDFIEMTFSSSAGGTGNIRYGLGASANVTADVTLSPLMVEFGAASSAYEAKAAGNGSATEVFRGNTAKFPRLAAIVAEVGALAAVTIYDLTQPGRPMWKRFVATTANAVRQNIASLAMLNGELVIGSNVTTGDLHRIHFIRDGAASTSNVEVRVYNGNLAQCNDGRGHLITYPGVYIASRFVNAVAMMVRPTAPIDPVTNLPVPTIGVAVGTGSAGQIGTVLMDDGTAVNYSASGNDGAGVAFTRRGDVVWTGSASTNVCVMPLATSNVSNIFGGIVGGSRLYNVNAATNGPALALPGTNKRVTPAGALIATYATTNVTGNNFGVVLHRENPSTPGAGLVANITGTYNTGWMTGAIQRCLLADTIAGTASGADLVVNGSFASDLSGWTTTINGGGGSVVWSSGGAALTGDGTLAAAIGQSFPTVPGKTFTLTFDVGGSAVSVFGGPSFQSGLVFNAGAQAVGAGRSVTFTATGTTTWVTFNKQSAQQTTVDNVTLREVIADRSVRNTTARINGTLALTAVAAGAQMVAASGFSATNYIQEAANSADLGYGTGAWTDAGWFNVAATGFGPANFVRNSTMQGAANGVTGSGGSIPTGGWFLEGAAGNTSTTKTITVGTAENGLPCIDIRIAGTPDLTFSNINFEAINQIAAQIGQSWTTSAWVKLQAGTLTNITGTNVTLFERTGAGAFIAGGVTPFTLDGTLQRVSGPRTIVNSNAAFVNGGLTLSHPVGQPIDLTIRIAGAQINRGLTAGTYVATSGTAFNGIAPISHYGAATGPYRTLGIDGNGQLAAEAFDGTTTRRVTSSFPVNDGQWHKARANYNGAGALALTIDGSPNTIAPGTALNSLTNANALLTIGNNFALNAAFPGSIALVKTGTTVPTAEQAAWMFAQERAMFQPGAQVTLGDTGAVVGMDYDPALDKLLVVTAANESNFNGLVRTSLAPVPAGSYSRVFGMSGVELLARTGTNPGVDVTIPPQNLRAELIRRAEDAARLARITSPFNFDATASQTDFPLPLGYEIVEVSAARQDQREGASRDWVRVFDGFRETVRFNTGQAVNTWVQVMGRRTG